MFHQFLQQSLILHSSVSFDDVILIVVIRFAFLAVGALVSKFLAISTFWCLKPAAIIGDVVIFSTMIAIACPLGCYRQIVLSNRRMAVWILNFGSTMNTMLIFLFDDSHELLGADQLSMISIFGDGIFRCDVDVRICEIIP